MKKLIDKYYFFMRARAIRKKIARMGTGVYKPGNSSKKGYLYNPIPFPEFSDVPYQREACFERFDLISKNLPEQPRSNKTTLDIGCHTGFNCFMFDRHGYACTGIEMDKLSFEIARDVARLYDLKIKFINDEVNPENLVKLGKFDVCLFLSVFQWISLQRGYDFAKETLKQAMLSSDVLFFETSMGNEGRAKMPMLPDIDSVAGLLSELNVHAKVTCLGDALAPNQWLGKKRYIFKTER